MNCLLVEYRETTVCTCNAEVYIFMFMLLSEVTVTSMSGHISRLQYYVSYIGLVCQSVGWAGLDQRKWTHGQLQSNTDADQSSLNNEAREIQTETT